LARGRPLSGSGREIAGFSGQGSGGESKAGKWHSSRNGNHQNCPTNEGNQRQRRPPGPKAGGPPARRGWRGALPAGAPLHACAWPSGLRGTCGGFWRRSLLHRIRRSRAAAQLIWAAPFENCFQSLIFHRPRGPEARVIKQGGLNTIGRWSGQRPLDQAAIQTRPEFGFFFFRGRGTGRLGAVKKRETGLHNSGRFPGRVFSLFSRRSVLATQWAPPCSYRPQGVRGGSEGLIRRAPNSSASLVAFDAVRKMGKQYFAAGASGVLPAGLLPTAPGAAWGRCGWSVGYSPRGDRKTLPPAADPLLCLDPAEGPSSRSCRKAYRKSGRPHLVHAVPTVADSPDEALRALCSSSNDYRQTSTDLGDRWPSGSSIRPTPFQHSPQGAEKRKIVPQNEFAIVSELRDGQKPIFLEKRIAGPALVPRASKPHNSLSERALPPGDDLPDIIALGTGRQDSMRLQFSCSSLHQQAKILQLRPTVGRRPVDQERGATISPSSKRPSPRPAEGWRLYFF